MRRLNLSSLFSADENTTFQVLWEDGERVLCRGERRGNGDLPGVLAVLPAVEHPASATLDRLAHEYGLKDELDRAWAVRPLQLVRKGGRTMLVLEDPGGQPLERQLGRPMELGQFLRLAIGLSAALGELHERGIIHKDIKPANVLVNSATEQVWLTGFGIASRLPRERQALTPPEVIAGTLAYMAPEQTGRMNRSIDARSDLYALGVTLYQMLTGALPFTAADPLEWVHCHIARKPTPPSERLETLPAPISEIVLKLLAKTAEERYQTASGLERDLRRCLAEWELNGRIDPFTLGEHDMPDRLVIPEKLYGRGNDIDVLLTAFDRVLKSGAPELVLVSGYSGIGKSSVVNELHKVLVPPRGLFSSGKFDQLKRDIPYAPLAQAFQSLIRPLLGKSDAELASWRDAFQETLGPNGQLMIDLVPELKLIIGDQPPVPELGPQDAQRRFQWVFRRFLDVFCQPEHPLALFLDDLQWLDAATLDLIEYLLTQSDLKHLMLIGAYRDNEVDAVHPLTRKLEAIRRTGARVQEIRLAPLGSEHLRELTTDTLRCGPARAAALANLVHEKTAGNPFFAIQFLHALADEGLLTFDAAAARWSWDLDRLYAKGYTDNVADLMVRKLVRRPEKTQQVLQQLACLGAVADTTTLAIVLGISRDQVHVAFWDALSEELVERRADSYRFIHDRVQEAAYSLIPEASCAEAHLRIGRLILTNAAPDQREQAIFEIVNQLNRGAPLMSSSDEREQLAQLNLIAGKRAKASTAYGAALKYLAAGAAQLPEDSWERRRELMFELELHRAECEFFTGGLPAAENRLALLSARAANTVERAAVACLRIDVCTTRGRMSEAVSVGLACLQHVGVAWTAHPSDEEVRREYQLIWSRLGGRAIEELVDLPLMTDPASLAVLNVLTKLGPPAVFTDANLLALISCGAVSLSLERGNSDGSSNAYVRVGMVAGPFFGDYKAGYRFGRVGYELVERRDLKHFLARIFMNFGNQVTPWTRHARSGRDLLHRAFDVANKTGDLTYAAYSRAHLNSNMLMVGDSLDEVQREVEQGLALAQRMQFELVIEVIATQLALVRMLRGSTRRFGSFDDEQFDEGRIVPRLSGNRNLAFAECWYWTRKLQGSFLAGDFSAAVGASLRVQPLIWTSLPTIETAEYHFYSALARASSCDSASADQRRQHLQALAAHHEQIGVWAENCPENFENRAALVGAEIARLEGRELDAERLYERAIHSAQANSFVHNEALAYELAGRFYMTRGFKQFAHLYLRKARYCYLRWGAHGKVRHLDELYPYLKEDEPAFGLTSTIGAPIEHLDLATVVKVSQAISGEIVLQKLVDTLMRTAVEQAGAARGLLMLLRGAKPQIEAEATSGGDTLILHQRGRPAMLPESVLHYVLRTRESVILDDAASQSPFDADPYIRERQARSILCLPLITQAKLIGVLYLENNLSPHVFVPARIAVLKLVASQAAIALENSRLYGDLQEREAKIRRLVDANIIGIVILDFEGPIIEANDAFLRMVGYDREDLVSGRIRWTDLTPPEWRDRKAEMVEEVKMTGIGQPHEIEYFRKDGSRVPVLVGAASFEETGNQGVAFVLDLTERKQAEDARRELAADFAHMNRVSMMGELAASLVHEITQPIASVRNDARAAQNFFDMQPPDLLEVREALACIVGDANRAAEIIDRIRAQIKKAPPRKERFDLNAAINEVIILARSATNRNGVSVETRLADGVLPVQGDRVQLQQVLLNLILNAVEAMGSVEAETRELLVSTEHDHTDVLVAVRDSGPGIDQTHLERVFEAFYTTKSSGTGMGLSICRNIIDAHGGKLWAAANEPRGAVFQFTMPCA